MQNPSMISTIAEILKVSEVQARDFYQEVSKQLNPKPSLHSFIIWLRLFRKPRPSVSELVDFIIAQRKEPSQPSERSPIRTSSRKYKGKSPKRLEWDRKMATARHLRPTIMPEPKAPKVNKGLVAKIAALLPKEDKNDLNAATLFLLDMQKIHPDFRKEIDLFLAAVKRCAKRDKVTVDEVWETMWRLRNPGADKVQVISIPMGGKK